MAKFNKLDVPYQWKDEFTKYPHGYTIFEALCKWTKQVDDMVDNQNTWNDYLDNFVENFEFELQQEVQSTIERWQNEGLLDDIIESALHTELDNLTTDYVAHKTDYATHKTDYATHKADYVKHRNIYVSEEPPTIEDGEEGDIFLTPKQIQTGFFTPIVKLGDDELEMLNPANQIGRYTVIDNICFIAVDILVENQSNSSGYLTIHGFPFPTANNRPHNSIPINFVRGLSRSSEERCFFINFNQGYSFGNVRVIANNVDRNINDSDFNGEVFMRFSGFYFID